MQIQVKQKMMRKYDDGKLDGLLEVAENIRRLAEVEADQIIEEARRKATVIKINALIETGKESDDCLDEDEKQSVQAARKATGHRGLRCREIFQVILDRERSRADRNNHELSLLIFALCDVRNEKRVAALLRALKTRARTIDRFGWFNDGQIGVILPNTNHKGAAKFAHDVCEMTIDRKSVPPDFKVYTYPSSWFTRKASNSWAKSAFEGKLDFIEGSNPLFVKRTPLWKRMIDIVGASITLILASPLFVFVPLIILIVSPGPVFFKQKRVGAGGLLFTFLKFRTMHPRNDCSTHQEYLGELIKTDKPMRKLDKSDDPRIITLGKWLRKSSIDELPQLFNVLRGDMSLVGPRPCLPYEAKEYLKWHKYRFDIHPGMTGLWQVSGKNQLTFKEMIRLDIMYAKKMNYGLDLWILLRTIPAVIALTIDKFAIDAFFKKVEKKEIPEEQFKDFIKRYYSDIYNVDRLKFLDDKLKNYNIDLMQLVLLLSRLHRLSPSYNAAKRYFGICRLIDVEKKAGSRDSRYTRAATI